MKHSICNLCFLGLILSAQHSNAAEVTVSVGGSSPLLFEISTDTALSGGTMFIGAFSSPPNPGISINNVISDFDVFGTLNSTSEAFGNFVGETVIETAIPNFEGLQIYLVVADSASLASATEYAVFSSNSSSWIFPDDGSLIPNSDRTTIDLTDTNQYFVGSADTLDPDGPGTFGTFNSVRLVPVGPPPAPTLPQIKHVIVGGKPGIEFEFPTADAGTVDFVLQESAADTLLEPDWTDVAATPSVISDDGTTQVIQILHPDLVTADSEQFLRLKGTTL